MAETNKILGMGRGFWLCRHPGGRLCVRVGAMRCHSQALTFKLKKDVPVADLEAMIAADNEWVKGGAQHPRGHHQGSDPVAVTGTMTIPWAASASWRWALSMGAFTIGDQLLWVLRALRRMLRICCPPDLKADPRAKPSFCALFNSERRNNQLRHVVEWQQVYASNEEPMVAHQSFDATSACHCKTLLLWCFLHIFTLRGGNQT